jgi:hypothetical protein
MSGILGRIAAPLHGVMTAGNKVACPYPGPKPFSGAYRELFFGRRLEAEDVLALILSQPVVLLYAASGAGKSSLINASVVPALKKRRADVIGPTRVSGKIPPGVSTSEIENIFAFHALHGLTAPEGVTPSRSMASIGGSGEIRTEPGDYRRMPVSAFIKARPRPVAERGMVAPPRVMIFDQFEEIFTTNTDRWQDRATFLDDLGAALEADSSFHVVFSMREEFVPAFERYANVFPGRLRSRYRLERLARDSALQAVSLPLEGTGYTFAKGAAETLVTNLMKLRPEEAASEPGVSVSATRRSMLLNAVSRIRTSRPEPTAPLIMGEFVDPVQLQVVCVQLWESLPPAPYAIDSAKVETCADVDTALFEYYDRCVKDAANTDVAKQAGVTEVVLRRWFETQLITSERTRATVFAGRDETEGVPTALVELLDKQYRLLSPELRGNSRWFELTHDRFIRPILESNRQFFEEQTGASALLGVLEDRAAAWAAKGRSKALLMDGGGVALAKRWRAGEGRGLPMSKIAEEYYLASETASTIRRRSVLAAGLVLVVAAPLIIWFVGVASQAKEAMYNERGSIAALLAREPGHEFDALLLGLRAVGPTVTRGKTPPDTAIYGLRTAVLAVGPGKWLADSTPISQVRFSPNGLLVAIAHRGSIAVWDTAGVRKLHIVPQLTARASPDELTPDVHWAEMEWTPDNKRLVIVETTEDAWQVAQQAVQQPKLLLRAFNVETGNRDADLEQRLSQAERVAFSPDSSLAITAMGNESRIVPLSGDGASVRLPRALDARAVVRWSRRHPHFFIGDENGLELWTTRGNRVWQSDVKVPTFADLQFAAGESLLVARQAARTPDRPVELIDPANGNIVGTRGPASGVTRLTVSQDGRRVAVFTSDSVFIEPITGDGPKVAMGYPKGLFPLQFDNRGVSLFSEQSLVRWDPLGSGQLTHFRSARVDSASLVRISSTGKTALVYLYDATIARLYSVDDGPFDVANASVGKLYATACTQLKSHRAELEIAQKNELCRDTTTVAARGQP